MVVVVLTDRLDSLIETRKMFACCKPDDVISGAELTAELTVVVVITGGATLSSSSKKPPKIFPELVATEVELVAIVCVEI